MTIDPVSLFQHDHEQYEHAKRSKKPKGPLTDGIALAPPNSFLSKIVKFLLECGRCLEVKAQNTTFSITDVGALILESLVYRVDLQSKNLITDLNKFQGTLDHHKFEKGEAPVSLRILASNLIYQPGEANDLEDLKGHKQMIDLVIIEGKGIINKSNLMISDLITSCRFGTLNLHADKILRTFRLLQGYKGAKSETVPPTMRPQDVPLDDVQEKAARSASDYLGVIIRVMKNIELKISSAGIFNVPLPSNTSGDITLAASVKDFAVDISRLNSQNPSFRLYFQDKDIAHQMILTCSSFMFGMDNSGVQEEVLYIPLISALARTNIFSQTARFAQYSSFDRNNTVLSANVNMTAPSISMEPHHMGIFQAVFRSGSRKDAQSAAQSTSNSFQSLWPKASVKFTIEDPAARVLVHKPEGFGAPIPYAKLSLTNELSGLVVCTCSKIYTEFSSSHQNSTRDTDYSLQTSFQINNLDAWYRSSEGRRFDFFSNEWFCFNVNAAIQQSISVTMWGQCDKPRILSIHSEVLYGIRELLSHVKIYTDDKSSPPSKPEKKVFIRSLPTWLESFEFTISSLTVAVAADALMNYITTSRGAKFIVDKIDLNYKAVSGKDLSSNPDRIKLPSDNRSFDISIEGISGYKILGIHYQKSKLGDPFLEIPTYQSSLFTYSDDEVPVTELKTILPNATINWDFNLQFLISLCIYLTRATFLATPVGDKPVKEGTKLKPKLSDAVFSSFQSHSIVLKAMLPMDVKVMLEISDFAMEKVPSGFPAVSSTAIRLYTTHPHVSDAWTRLVVFRGLAVDIKDHPDNFGKTETTDTNEQILMSTESVRINLAHQLIVYKVLDNLITSFKGAITLVKRALLAQPTYIFPLKEKKGVPNIPKIRIKSKNLLFSIEDDLFESKLGLIFQIGLREQKRRLDYEAAFQAKCEMVKLARAKAKRAQNPDEKSSHRHPTGKQNEFSKHAEGPSFMDSILNNKSARTNPRASTAPAATPVVEKPLHKIRHANTFKAFQSSIHPFHLSTPHPDTKSSSKDPGYKLIDSMNYSENAKVDIETARHALNEFYSKSWIREYNKAESNQKETIKEQIINSPLNDPISPDMAAKEKIVDYSPFPFLFYLLFTNVDWFISKPAMNEKEIRDFLFDVGKGVPRDTKFGVFVPLYNKLTCDSIRAQLRDYPLPLLYFPRLDGSQNKQQPSIVAEGNFVIAESFSTLDSNIRRVFVPIDSLYTEHFSYPDKPTENPFLVEVHRTVASVKVYTDLKFNINTLIPSVFTWCVSMQPALQTTMQVFDLLSKPPQDPSEKLGFWDNIRSIFHARLQLNWPEGNVHFQLKGSTNPYFLVRESAGFVMCWKNNVQLSVNAKDNPQEFMVVTSDDYMLAIPDFSFQEREYLSRSVDKTVGLICNSNFKDFTVFQKVIMKLSGKVKWTAGLVFERMSNDGKSRTFQFKPHYDVVLSNPQSVKDIENYDAYRGFRSKFIHLAVSVSSTPENWKNEACNDSYNSIHLSPEFFAHFFRWWGLFDGATSLPIRAGKIFEISEKQKSKKFGRHLFTVKYQLRLSPLFITHAYIHTSYNSSKKTTSSTTTGLKAKVDKFMMDLHQRRAQSGPGKRWKMGLNVGETDFIGTDLRVLQAYITEKSHEEALADSLGFKTSPGSSFTGNSSGTESFSLGKFDISDNDYSWIDSDDYREVGETRSSKTFPRVTILPLSYTPRWTYFRHTDHGANNGPIAPFGNELSHECLIGKGGTDHTQKDLMRLRHRELTEQLETNETMLESLQKDFQGVPDSNEVAQRAKKVQHDISILKDHISKIERLIQENGDKRDIVQAAFEKSAKEVNHGLKPRNNDASQNHTKSVGSSSSATSIENSPAIEGANEFNNIFLVHSTQVKWNNEVRNALYSYLHRVGERKSSAYYVTQRAVKYLEDLIKQQKQHANYDGPKCSNEHFPKMFSDFKSTDGESSSGNFDADLHAIDNDDYFAVDNHLVRLVSPQFQFISQKNPDKCVLVTSEHIELKMVNIKDKNIEDDVASQLVETRFGVSLHGAQFFVIDKEKVSNGAYTLFSANTYGCGKMPMWPPWVSIEYCYNSLPLRNALIIEKTTVDLRYDKPNSLRVQSSQNEDPASPANMCTSALIRSKHNRQNSMSVDFPKIVAVCDSAQFYTCFTVVMDLILYTEPQKKETSERLEKVLLATDFTNLEGASNRVIQLQNDIRKFSELQDEFLVRLNDMNRQSINDLARIDMEMNHTRLELYVIMEAIKSGIRKGNKVDDSTKFLKWTIGAEQIIWHVLDEKHKPFLDVGLANASFNRIQGTDGFNTNSIEIGMLQVFNLTPGSRYAEVVSPYLPKGKTYDNASGNVLSINWTLLDPIGGIPIVQDFEIIPKPIKVQIESDTWNKLFNFIFPKTDQGHVVSPFNINASASGKNNTQSAPPRVSADFDISSSDEEDQYESSLADDTSSVASSSVDTSNSKLFKPIKFLKKSSSETSSEHSSRSKGFFNNGHRELMRSSTLSSTNSGDSGGSKQSSRRRGTVKKKDSVADDLSLMMNRASSYFSIVKVRLHSTTACISFKGEGAKTVLDLHEFVLTIPEIQYENKTWTNMEAVLHIKKDLTRILLRHSGSLLGNKFKRHHRQHNIQQLHQIQSYNSYKSVSDLSNDNSRSSVVDDDDDEPYRGRRDTLVLDQSLTQNTVLPFGPGSGNGGGNSSKSSVSSPSGKTDLNRRLSRVQQIVSHHGKDKDKDESDKKSITSSLKKLF